MKRENTPERRQQSAGVQVVLKGRSLAYWKDAISAVCRSGAYSSRCPDHDRLALEIVGGRVRLMGRDHWRAHWVTVPALTEGRASVSVPRDAILPSEFGVPGLLCCYERRVIHLPDHEGYPILEVPAEQAAFPEPGEREALGGVLLDRAALLEVLLATEEPVLRLRRQGRELRVGEILLPVEYGHGAGFDVLMEVRFLVDAMRSGDAQEVALEYLGPEAPVRIESGSLLALVTTRSEESLI